MVCADAVRILVQIAQSKAWASMRTLAAEMQRGAVAPLFLFARLAAPRLSGAWPARRCV